MYSPILDLSLRLSLLALLVVPLDSTAVSGVPAFPGAEGFGTDTPGGRTGQVLFVTTVADHDDGACDADCTLREAIGVAGKRMVLFRIGGTITLDPDLGPLLIDEPFITIAGQTALGDGIQIRNDPDGTDGAQLGLSRDSFASLEIETNDVVVRHLRIRPGLLNENPGCNGPDSLPNTTSQPGTTCLAANDIEPIRVENASNVVLDHLSLSWATDEIVSILGSSDVTLQWSIVSEGIKYIPFLLEQPTFSGTGLITGTTPHAAAGKFSDRISIHHNAFVHNYSRNPQITVSCADENGGPTCGTDLINNVIYDWRNQGILTSNQYGHSFVNVMFNYLRIGPDFPQGAFLGLRLQDYVDEGSGAALSVHHHKNREYVSPGVTQDMAVYCQKKSDEVTEECDAATYDPGSPHTVPGVTTISAEDALAWVGYLAGASIRREANGATGWNRDANDQRVLDDIANGSGSIIEDPDDVPDWPTLNGGTAFADADNDGMPDVWETANCFDPAVANDALDADADGYTNLEEYLNATNSGGCP
jgi:CSLREA domain-containing protein